MKERFFPTNTYFLNSVTISGSYGDVPWREPLPDLCFLPKTLQQTKLSSLTFAMDIRKFENARVKSLEIVSFEQF